MLTCLVNTLDPQNDIYMYGANRAYYHNNYDASVYGGKRRRAYMFLRDRDNPSFAEKVFHKKYGTQNCTDTDRLFHYLFKYYADLDDVLGRWRKGVRDPLTYWFQQKAYAFSSVNRFKITLNIWEDIYTEAALDFYQNYHEKYDETISTSYKSYFDYSMAKLLYDYYLSFQKEFRYNTSIEGRFKSKIYLNHSLTDAQIYEQKLTTGEIEYQLNYLQSLSVQ